MIEADAELTDKELFALILMPDFSTAKKVTSVSGRGVGLDVVKKAIEALRGTIEITSTRGAGATITLKLPLTLAIIDGFLTRIGAEHFIFELSSVQECIELSRENGALSKNRNLVNVRGSIVPFIRLREQFDVDGEPPAIEQIVIVQEERPQGRVRRGHGDRRAPDRAQVPGQVLQGCGRDIGGYHPGRRHCGPDLDLPETDTERRSSRSC